MYEYFVAYTTSRVKYSKRGEKSENFPIRVRDHATESVIERRVADSLSADCRAYPALVRSAVRSRDLFD